MNDIIKFTVFFGPLFIGVECYILLYLITNPPLTNLVLFCKTIVRRHETSNQQINQPLSPFNNHVTSYLNIRTENVFYNVNKQKLFRQ